MDVIAYFVSPQSVFTSSLNYKHVDINCRKIIHYFLVIKQNNQRNYNYFIRREY